jgi:hypothetical protein
MVEAGIRGRSVLLLARARGCAEQLGLEFETCFTGLGSFHRTLPVETDRPKTLEESR